MDQRELPALAVGRRAVAGGPIGVCVPAVGGDEGQAVDADAHSLPVLAAGRAKPGQTEVMRRDPAVSPEGAMAHARVRLDELANLLDGL